MDWNGESIPKKKVEQAIIKSLCKKQWQAKWVQQCLNSKLVKTFSGFLRKSLDKKKGRLILEIRKV